MNQDCYNQLISKYTELDNRWWFISRAEKLSEEFIRTYKHKVDWHYISQFQKLSEGFIREFKDEVSWEHICQYQILSAEFIEEFKNDVNWYHISKYQKLSINTLRKFKENLDWGWITFNQILTEDMIREFEDNVIWDWVGQHQILSEEFIREFKDKLDWNDVFKYQKLSLAFIQEFKYKFKNKIIGTESIKLNPKIDMITKSKLGLNIPPIAFQFNCGSSNRTIHVVNHIIKIGCSQYTISSAIAAISKEYDHDEIERDKYIQKVNDCFEEHDKLVEMLKEKS